MIEPDNLKAHQIIGIVVGAIIGGFAVGLLLGFAIDHLVSAFFR